MTEWLKVLKFIAKRMVARLIHIRYKGLYAFLCGVTVFAVCFGGKGENAPASEENNAVPYAIAAEAAVPLSNIPASVSFADDSERISETSDENAEDKPNASDSEKAAADLSSASAAEEKSAANARIKENKAKTEAAGEEAEAGEADAGKPSDGGENPPGRKEAEAASVMYVCRDGIYSRKEAVEGSEKVKRYALNERVTVTLKTDTEYYELDSGAFIHSDYLSGEETPKWRETEAQGVMYVCRDGIYSRREAIEGAEKVKRYGLNELVTVTAKTDTEYYRLSDGAFIHADYLSGEETPKWTETETSGVMYVCRGGIYSRAEAVEGSEKLEQYKLNDSVSVIAETDTGYYKLEGGGFIHSDYLSPAETVEYPLSDRYGQRPQSDWEKELAQQVVEIVNGIREEKGLKPFKQMDSLTAAAAERAWETTFYNSHNRPDGTRCFTVLDQYGLSSSSSSKAENIAMWSSSAQAVVDAWMNDYGHRINILGDFEYIGVGCYYIESDYYKYYWAQEFYGER